jgi:hypothetical protein
VNLVCTAGNGSTRHQYHPEPCFITQDTVDHSVPQHTARDSTRNRLINKCRYNIAGIPRISREILAGNWQYLHNLCALPIAYLFCFRFHRQGFLGKWKIIFGVPAWKKGLETPIERKDFRSERFWCRLEPWVCARLWIRVFTARSFSNAHTKVAMRHAAKEDMDVVIMETPHQCLKICAGSPRTRFDVCAGWTSSGEVPVPVEDCVRMTLFMTFGVFP